MHFAHAGLPAPTHPAIVRSKAPTHAAGAPIVRHAALTRREWLSPQSAPPRYQVRPERRMHPAHVEGREVIADASAAKFRPNRRREPALHSRRQLRGNLALV